METDVAKPLAPLLNKIGEQVNVMGQRVQEVIGALEGNPDILCTHARREVGRYRRMCSEIEEGLNTLRLQPFSCKRMFVHTLLGRIQDFGHSLKGLEPLLLALGNPEDRFSKKMRRKLLISQQEGTILSRILPTAFEDACFRVINPVMPTLCATATAAIASLRESTERYAEIRDESGHSIIENARSWITKDMENQKEHLPAQSQLDNLKMALAQVLVKFDPEATIYLSEAVPALIVRVCIVSSRLKKIIGNELPSTPQSHPLEFFKGFDILKLHGRVKYYLQEVAKTGSLKVELNIRRLLAHLARFDAAMKCHYLRAYQALEEAGSVDTPLACATEDTDRRHCGAVSQQTPDVDALWFHIAQKRMSLDTILHSAIADYFSFEDERLPQAIRAAKETLRKRPRRAPVEGYQSTNLSRQGTATCTQRDSESSGSDCDECFDQRVDCGGKKRARSSPKRDALAFDDIGDCLQCLFKV
ncbi:hypothetical protein NMY22_g17600 [Coprinellus aureogranulatus]|nr:hypothetical protein NMY22_g17600 [Coprinellus aureogranulatus]